MTSGLQIRDARSTDLEGLASIRYADQRAMYRDRLRDAALGHLRFLVAEVGGRVVGFGLLVFSRPATWPDAGTEDHLPGILDLYVAEAHRGRGIGTAIIGRMEALAVDQGCGRLWLSVDPIENARAHALYARLGYRALQAEPYCDRWRFVDSEGCVHEGKEWLIDMVKAL
jgi:GNAT superfamily N-acetyltransferase